ncbi:MAG: acetylesterase [Anaerocolumna sp.]|jgi:S-formylglutathione hydrolase FrmB|nr:acetylesterase [Anaerocolumna sp.]
MALAQVNFFSKSLMRTVTMNVILPVDNYSFQGESLANKEGFKTLYLLHGMLGNYTDWVSGTRIGAWAQENNLVVVMPSGDNHFYVDQKATGDLYGEFIGEELVEVTRRMFPLSNKREDTFIAGLSMGGYGAIRNGLKYADTFGFIAGLSSGLILDNIPDSTEDAPVIYNRRSYYKAIFGDIETLFGSDMDYKYLITSLKNQNKSIPSIYLACGTEDFLIEENRDYRDFLKAEGVDFTYVEGPGGHDWVFWDTYIKKVLEWLPLSAGGKGISSGNVK